MTNIDIINENIDNFNNTLNGEIKQMYNNLDVVQNQNSETIENFEILKAQIEGDIQLINDNIGNVQDNQKESNEAIMNLDLLVSNKSFDRKRALVSGGSVKSPTDRITDRTKEKKITDNRPTEKLGITGNHRKTKNNRKCPIFCQILRFFEVHNMGLNKIFTKIDNFGLTAK